MKLCPSYSIMWSHSKMHFLMSPGSLEMDCIRGRSWCLWREYLLSSAHVMLGDFGCSFLVCSGFHQCSGHNRLCWDLHSFGVGSLVRDVSLHLLLLIICKYVHRLDQEVICTHLVLWLNFVLLKYWSIWGPSTMILWCGFQGHGIGHDFLLCWYGAWSLRWLSRMLPFVLSLGSYGWVLTWVCLQWSLCGILWMVMNGKLLLWFWLKVCWIQWYSAHKCLPKDALWNFQSPLK